MENTEKQQKKRIAVFANAWSEKNLSNGLEGIKKCAQEADYDVFIFVSHASPGMDEDEQREEKRIYQLPDLSDFDGAIVISYTMNFVDLVEDICRRANEANVPVVSAGLKIQGAAYVDMNNKKSMIDLVEHIVTEHHVEDVEFIAGPKGHDSSETRIEALKYVFEKHNIPFSDDHIHYGDWSVRGGMKMAKEILQKRKDHYPQAFVCANDGLALAVCAEIERAGLKIPRDIIVTGHDYIHDGQIFYPALCTVEQNDFEVGQASFRSLMKLMRGEKAEDILIDNHFIKNQSCGCENLAADAARLEDCKHRYYDNISNLEFGWSNSWITRLTLSNQNLEVVKEKLEGYFKASSMFNNGTTYIIQDLSAESYLAEQEIQKSQKGYSDELNVIVAVEQREVIPIRKIARRELIPGYKKIPGVTKMYLFLPAHFQDWVFGYIVLEDWLEGIGNTKIVKFMDNFGQTIIKLKENMALERLNTQLRDLYNKDSLTGMYNRFGFNSEGFKIFDHCKANKQDMMLMFIDINRMKIINDYYGHLQGDMAIKTVAEVIMQSVSENWIAIRFGGDEFLVIGKCEDEEEIKAVQNKITEGVKTTGKRLQYPFYLSVSCGYMHFCPKEDRTLDSYIKETDEAMYEIKAYMHSTDAELRAFVERCRGV